MPLLKEALRRRNLVLFDLLVDLVVPPVGELVAFIAAGAVLCVIVGHGGAAPWIWGLSFAGVALYVLRGWMLSGIGLHGFLDLMWAPVYVAWKLTLWLRHKGQRPIEWIRTTREGKT